MSKTLQTLTVMESNKLLDVLLPVTGTLQQRLNGMRNYTIGLLLLDAGLRVGEVAKLIQTDLIIEGKPVTTLQVTSQIAKGGRERTIPLSQRIRHAVEMMQENWWSGPRSTYTPFAFYQMGERAPITTRQVQRIIKEVAIKAIGRPIHPHILRHTFATRLMRMTNIRVVQKLLGHASISSTQVYTHPNDQDLKKAIDAIAVADVT